MVEYEFPAYAGQTVTITEGVQTLTIENGVALLDVADTQLSEMAKRHGGKLVVLSSKKGKKPEETN